MDILARLKEPSTYASFAAALVGFGVIVPDIYIQGISMVLAGIASLAGVFLAEKK